MTNERVTEMLRSFGAVAQDSRLDFERSGEHLFRVTEVRADSSIAARLVGFVRGEDGLVYSLEPDLTFEQARVYDAVLPRFAGRILEGQATDERRFLLIKEGDLPELFDRLDFNRSLAANVKPEMLPVWHSLENLLLDRGFQPSMVRRGNEPCEIWAEPLETPPSSFERG